MVMFIFKHASVKLPPPPRLIVYCGVSIELKILKSVLQIAPNELQNIGIDL